MDGKKIGKLEEEFEVEKKKNNEKISKLDREYTSLLHEYEELKEQTEKRTAEMISERENLEATFKLKLENYSKREADLQTQLNQMQEDIACLKS